MTKMHRLLPLVLLASFDTTPASAQIDVTGEWGGRIHEDRPNRDDGPTIADFAGVPLNDATRFNAEAWDSSIVSLREHQAQLYTSALAFHAPGNLRITKVVDDQSQGVAAYSIYIGLMQMVRTVWMDGRPHPPDYAPHTWMGFSTGRWDGRTLIIETTHLKAGYAARNGVRHSDRATMTEYLVRHERFLTTIVVLNDPLCFDEPYVQSWNFEISPDQRLNPKENLQVSDEVPMRRKGHVPHYLPGQNPYLTQFADQSGLPVEATRGGKETMYPEFAAKLQNVRTKAIVRLGSQ